MQDATPLSLGQEFSGFSSAIKHSIERVEGSLQHCFHLPMGGTAVGTGINSFEGFAELAAENIASITKLPFVTAPNKFEGLAGQDCIVELSGSLKTLSGSLLKLQMILDGCLAVLALESVKLLFLQMSQDHQSCLVKLIQLSAKP